MSGDFQEKITTDLTSSTYQDALWLRRQVFIKEQNVSEALEIDSEEDCQYFVLYQEGQPIATARLRQKADQTGKVERVAVSKAARGKGAGREIMRVVETAAKAAGAAKIILGAQDHAIEFYEKLGYQIISEPYLDADIVHQDMEKIL